MLPSPVAEALGFRSATYSGESQSMRSARPTRALSVEAPLLTRFF